MGLTGELYGPDFFTMSLSQSDLSPQQKDYGGDAGKDVSEWQSARRRPHPLPQLRIS